MLAPISVPAGPGSRRPSSTRLADASVEAAASAASILSLASGETIGQTSVSGSAPAPDARPRAPSASASTSASWRSPSPTATQTEPARQRWPAAPKAEARIAGTAMESSASGITTSEFFAPPSACTRLPLSAQRLAIRRAVEAWPTKETASTPSWPSSASTASRPPCTRLTTPGGSRRSRRRSQRSARPDADRVRRA